MNAIIYGTIYHLFNAIIWILIIRILLSWFPNIDWYRQPFKFLRDVADPVLEPFRAIIPTVSGIDFSPIVAFFALSILQRLTLYILGLFLF